jgi:hypothetical protein
MNVVNVEPDSGTKPDPVTSMKEEELLLPIIYPVPKTEGTVSYIFMNLSCSSFKKKHIFIYILPE